MNTSTYRVWIGASVAGSIGTKYCEKAIAKAYEEGLEHVRVEHWEKV